MQKGRIACAICGAAHHHLGPHLKADHNMTEAEYTKAHPDQPTVSEELLEAVKSEAGRGHRNGPPAPADLKLELAGLNLPVHADVPAEACLEIPPHYHAPTHGKLGEDCRMALISIASGNHTYIHGSPGTGKDALVHAYAGLTRRPSAIYQVRPDADIESWFFTHGFTKNGDVYHEGSLLRQLRDGYTCADGTVVPYLVLISDFDRASKGQAEAMRLILDSISGRVMGPQGKCWPVLAGTTITATANSAGGGDETGRCISSNPIDSSIMDRFEAGIKFHDMDWRDEELICKAKYPDLLALDPSIFDQVGQATKALRAAVAKDEMYAEFSHRGVCNWLSAMRALVTWESPGARALMKRAARMGFIDKLPDSETRLMAQRLIDPHLNGGALGHGSTKHQKTGDLGDY